MLLKFLPFSLFALHFLLLMISHANAKESQTKQMQNKSINASSNHHHHQMHSSSSSSSLPHMDHSVLVFITPNDLKQGNMIPIFFRPSSSSSSSPSPSPSSPHFLPREEADLIPFSLSKLPYLLQHFGFSPSSSQAKAMEETLRHCEVKPILGETKLCANSLESMLNFVHEIFGSKTEFRALSTHDQFGKNYGSNLLQNYTILNKPREIVAPKMVACHSMPYPYVVYYCHYQKSESRVFQVSLLRGENGVIKNNNNNNNNGNVIVEAIAVCHMDTSKWSPNHVSFRVLGSKPSSSSPVCHFFPADNLVWVPILYETQEASQDKVSNM